ncbi:MAG: D-sedoheptulose 7-phosphate isomerase [Bacteroidales bacterium]|nr:D-sedoheptulose 7-phosphate isomerase [Bacteroidales bacterium]
MNVRDIIEEAIDVKQRLLTDKCYLDAVDKTVEMFVEAFSNNNKVLFCGNGGSAADAQHIAAELSGRFYMDRPPLYAEALHVNSSYVTSVANDYSYDDIYARMTQAAGRGGDILVGISTSGNSENVVRAMKTAKEQGMKTIALTGKTGGRMKELADVLIEIQSTTTPRIQECHIMTGHIICELVEKKLFSHNNK